MPFHLFSLLSVSFNNSFVFFYLFLFIPDFLVIYVPHLAVIRLHVWCLRNFEVCLFVLLFSLFSTDFCGLRVLFGTEGTEINAWNNDLFIELLYLIGIRGVLPSIRDWQLAHQMNERAHSLDLRGTIKYRDWCVRVSMYCTVRSRVRIFLVYVQPSVLLTQCLLVKEQEIFSEIWHTNDG